MNIHVRRRRDTFIGIKAFGQDNAGDYPAGSIEVEQFAEMDDVIAGIEQFAARQTSGFGDARFTFNSKGINRELLRGAMTDISDIAGALAYKIPGIDLIFHIPKNLSDAAMLALGKTFYDKSAEYEIELKRALDKDFRAGLLAKAEAFEQSLTAPETAIGTQVEATAKLDELVRRGMVARRILSGVLKVRYKNNPAKWRAWLTASHIDKTSAGGEEENSEPNG
ncbi:MAG: hypothetical protein ABWZ66_00970 [Pyrinomonadaceae bacterium]